jgi:hypothetical protein
VVKVEEREPTVEVDEDSELRRMCRMILEELRWAVRSIVSPSLPTASGFTDRPSAGQHAISKRRAL